MAMQILKDTFMSYGRSKEINGDYDHSRTGCAEKAKEAEKAAEDKGSGKLSEPQDEYISSEKSGKEPMGLYRIGRDENGIKKIFFDDPKASHTDGKEPKTVGNNQGKPAEKCVTNTDKVDREIQKLKEKKQRLEQQIQSASGDETPSGHPSMPSDDRAEKKIRELEKKLAQVENELSQKDNDTYRRQNASVSE